MSVSDAQGDGHRRDYFRAAGATNDLVRKWKAAEAEMERLRAEVQYWRGRALGLIP